MRRLDIDLMQTLVAVLEEGSLSAAAPRLHRSQSAVSEQIRKLEDASGQVLLTRSKAGVRATPAGTRLVAHARRILALHDLACDDMRGASLDGDLRLAVTDYFRPAALANILRNIRECYPRLRLHVSVRKSAAIEDDVETFDIGLSMRILDSRSEKLDGRRFLRREPLMWVAAPDYVYANPMPLLALPDGCAMHRFATELLDRYSIRYFVAHSASGIGGLQSALAAGLGVSCLNASSIPESAQRLNFVQLPALPEVEFSLVRSRAGEAHFVSEVRDMLAERLGGT